jgi:hypothetical protein
MHNHPLGFGSVVNRPPGVLILPPGVFKLVKLTPLSIFFVTFANKICHMHCTWVYNNKFFILKWLHAMHVTNFY